MKKIIQSPGFIKTHLFVLVAFLLMLMLNQAEAYRTFSYLNLSIAGLWAVVMLPELSDDQKRQLLWLLSLPMLFSLLNVIATGHLAITKDIRHIWQAVGVMLGVMMLASHWDYLKSRIENVLLFVLLAYVLSQVLAVFVLRRPHGSMSNPHYLALYSSLLVPLASYLLVTSSGLQRWLAGLSIPVLLGLILTTSSRPAWLALIITALASVFLLQGRSRYLLLAVLVLTPALLFLTNMDGFADRCRDLVMNIAYEERVVIWKDAWQMQLTSNTWQWLWGHGLDSYQTDFKIFSHYRGIMDFNSPHNSLLDMLYIAGIFGVLGFLALYYYLYKSLLVLLAKPQMGFCGVMLFAMVTINLLMIFITIPTLSHYNLYTLAILSGLLTALNRNPLMRQT